MLHTCMHIYIGILDKMKMLDMMDPGENQEWIPQECKKNMLIRTINLQQAYYPQHLCSSCPHAPVWPSEHFSIGTQWDKCSNSQPDQSYRKRQHQWRCREANTSSHTRKMVLVLNLYWCHMKQILLHRNNICSKRRRLVFPSLWLWYQQHS